MFAVLQLCYNKLTGSIPTQLGNISRLSVLALQYNQLVGAIPASLGDLQMLTRLDLSFNKFFSSIPVRLVNPPMLEVLDVRNNSLTGIVPPGKYDLAHCHALVLLYRCFWKNKVIKNFKLNIYGLVDETQV